MDLQSITNLFRRRLRLLIAIIIAITAAVTAASFAVAPKYTATASIKIDPSSRQVLDKDAKADSQAEVSIITTEVELMRSPSVAKTVVRDLGLTKDPEFAPKKGPGANTTAKTAAALLSKVAAARRGSTYIVDLSVTSSDSAKAQRLANALAQSYVAASRQSQVAVAADQVRSLNEQLNSMGQTVRSADASIAAYRGATGITSGSGAQGTITDQQISSIATQLATAESDAAAARSQADAARSQITNEGIDAVSAVLTSPVITDLRRQRTEVVREQAQIAANYGPLHPSSIRIQQAIKDLDSQLLAESRRIVSGLQSEARAADARAASLRGQLAALRGQQSSNAQAAVQGDSLERDAEAKRDIYNRLAQTAQQTSQEERLGQGRGQIIAEADEPTAPSFPNHPLFAMLGLIVGAAIAGTTVLTLETFDSRVRTIADVEGDLGLPYIASVPLLSRGQLAEVKHPADFVLSRPVSGFAEAIRSIRVTLLADAPGGPGGRAFCITSAVPNEGKSSLALSIARIMAMSGERVILVDCDLRRGMLSRLNGPDQQKGLIEVLKGEVDWRSVIQRDVQDRLTVLTPVQQSFATEDYIGGAAMAALLNQLKAAYDVVILDAPPVLAVADVRRLAAMAEKSLMIIRWNATTREAVRTSLATLNDVGVKVTGAVLTLVDMRAKEALGYDSPAYYYQNNRKYYQD